MLAVADPKEVWIFEILPVGPLWTPDSGKPGAVWCAQRLPDDQVSVCPNESRIGEIDLNNKDFFLASPNVISCAVENKLYDPASGKPFNWKQAYSPARRQRHVERRPAVSGCGGSLTSSRPHGNSASILPNMDFPFSVKPDKKTFGPRTSWLSPATNATERPSTRSRASAAANF